MRAINHSLTGAVIGLSISDPLLALPLAFFSHYLLDVTPHFGLSSKTISSKVFNNLLIADTILCFLLVLIIFIIRPINWPLAIVCAFIAASPDLFSLNRYLKARHKLPWKPSIYSCLAIRIQWFEKPSGIIVEAVYFVAALSCLAVILKS